MVRPTPGILRKVGALGEFLSAHQHFRRNEIPDALVDDNNAFESTMRTICERRGIALAGKEEPDVLIQRVLGTVIPPFLAAGLTGLRSTMQTLPTLRSNTPGAGHGIGPKQKDIPDAAAAYAIHLAGATIVFLIEAFSDLERRDPQRKALTSV